MSENFNREEVYQEMLKRLKSPLYNIGEHVVLDNGTNGTVCSIMAPWFYTYIRPNANFSKWFQADKYWEEKNIYAILLDEQQRYISLEDWSADKYYIKDEYLLEVYEAQIPKVQLIMVPEMMIAGAA